MPESARITDTTTHGAPLGPGPGSANVKIGGQSAWRALPAGPLANSVEIAAGKVAGAAMALQLSPPAFAAELADIQASLAQAAADAAAAGNANATAAASSSLASLTATNATLTTTWAAASAAPGGEPAASQAYTKAIQSAVAATAGAIFTAIGGLSDLHNCPAPCPAGPHGPGLVARGSSNVRINGLPAARKDDVVVEVCYATDPIKTGCTTVIIGG